MQIKIFCIIAYTKKIIFQYKQIILLILLTAINQFYFKSQNQFLIKYLSFIQFIKQFNIFITLKRIQVLLNWQFNCQLNILYPKLFLAPGVNLQGMIILINSKKIQKAKISQEKAEKMKMKYPAYFAQTQEALFQQNKQIFQIFQNKNIFQIFMLVFFIFKLESDQLYFSHFFFIYSSHFVAIKFITQYFNYSLEQVYFTKIQKFFYIKQNFSQNIYYYQSIC
ncbi:transmembrane protein, putative (macronuclear) [Tetrahymena thermophila SB210]|uniref:Transmembrane protein, putative n=1 Tax=Tetrahymena thermophila (strain SB210) TaxID=312017 RepID=W7X5I3_TETTS|nr:transmembrane protein, putative [Tetrahymena thermophila SB210]EWS71618.1 transmembrane protein, putative [Tetrahymena thermophila SB210]|eukprot:XP_012655847.1 transmembrane protein, putative [Tetrahymena thermophila SB210]